MTRLGADCKISVEVDAGNYLPYRLSYGYSSHLTSFFIRIGQVVPFFTVRFSVYLSIYLYIYLSIYLSFYLSIYLSVFLSRLVDTAAVARWQRGGERAVPNKGMRLRKNNLFCLLRPLTCESTSSLHVSGPAFGFGPKDEINCWNRTQIPLLCTISHHGTSISKEDYANFDFAVGSYPNTPC